MKFHKIGTSSLPSNQSINQQMHFEKVNSSSLTTLYSLELQYSIRNSKAYAMDEAMKVKKSSLDYTLYLNLWSISTNANNPWKGNLTLR